MYNNDDIEFALDILRRHNYANAKQIERWLSANPDHLDLLQDLAALRQIADSTDYRSQLNSELRRIRRSIRPKRLRPFYWGAAAAVLLVVGTFFYLGRSQEEGADTGQEMSQTIPPGERRAELILPHGDIIALSRTNNQMELPQIIGVVNDSIAGLNYGKVEIDESLGEIQNTVRVPLGSFYTLTMSDGTKVWMNADSELNFPVKFLSNKREVYLRGEAYFEVAHDGSKPFVVRMDDARITVLGTSFNISTYGDDGYILATLVKGLVSMVSERNQTQVTLLPGQQGAVSIATGQITSRAVDVDQYTMWRNGKFVFESMTLESIMKQLHRWYDVQIEYRDPAIKNYEFKGVVNRNMNMEDILTIIAETTRIHFEIKDDKVVMMKR